MIAFVLGGAQGVWTDLQDAQDQVALTPDLLICVNHIGIVYPNKVDVWCSYHAELLHNWRGERDRNGLARPAELWIAQRPDRDRRWWEYRMLPCHGGSSGMLGVDVALTKGATLTVLCGIPMSPIPHFHAGQQYRPWREAEKHKGFWIKRGDELRAKGVRSMSGFTRELLGSPDAVPAAKPL